MSWGRGDRCALAGTFTFISVGAATSLGPSFHRSEVSKGNPQQILHCAPRVCTTTQNSPPFPREAQPCLRCSSHFSYPQAGQWRCAGIQTALWSAQGPRIGKGTLLGSHRATAASSAGQKTLAAAPHAEGNQRDFFKQIHHSSVYPSNTSLRLEMRCLAHLLHRKPEASYILLSSQLASTSTKLQPLRNMPQSASSSLVCSGQVSHTGICISKHCELNSGWCSVRVVQGKVLLT